MRRRGRCCRSSARACAETDRPGCSWPAVVSVTADIIPSMPHRREFLKVLGTGAVAAGMPAWAFARVVDPRQDPAPPVRDPRYREWSAVALGEARRLGCSYADIRFTRNRSQSLTLRNGQISTAPGFGGGGFGGRGGGGTIETYGFGIRVIHGGVWGFASSPIVTPTRSSGSRPSRPTSRARARSRRRSTSAWRRSGVDELWQMPLEKDPWSVPLEEKVELAAQRHQHDPEDARSTVRQRDRRLRVRMEGAGDERRMVHRAGLPLPNCSGVRDRALGDAGQDPQLRAPGGRRLRAPGKCDLPGQANGVAAEAVKRRPSRSARG